jgi:hypothetical protein
MNILIALAYILLYSSVIYFLVEDFKATKANRDDAIKAFERRRDAVDIEALEMHKQAIERKQTLIERYQCENIHDIDR